MVSGAVKIKSLFWLILIFLTATNLAFAAVKEESIADSLRQKAQAGDVYSQLKLGEEFLYGVNRSRNLNLAFYYFNMAAEQGSDVGNFYVGYCHEYGYGVTKNIFKAYSYYEKAISLDEAKFKVALILERGLRGAKIDGKYYGSIDQNKVRAKELQDFLISKKYPPAMVNLAEKLLKNRNITPESGQYIFELLSEAAEQNDVQAKKYLIDCYLEGIGTAVNEEQAFKEAYKLYTAEVKGVAGKLGLFYERGIGVAPDMLEAIKFYQIAADEGEGFAKVKIAEQHLSGFYLKTDVEKALKLLHEEMRNNNGAAIKILADCFLKGIGLEKDEKQAFLFYLRSAGLGDVAAQYELANCFRNGVGTQIDESAVFFWAKQGSSVGDIDCMRLLAECYAHGIGTPKEIKTAERLLIACVKAGDDKAALLLKRGLE